MHNLCACIDICHHAHDLRHVSRAGLQIGTTPTTILRNHCSCGLHHYRSGSLRWTCYKYLVISVAGGHPSSLGPGQPRALPFNTCWLDHYAPLFNVLTHPPSNLVLQPACPSQSRSLLQLSFHTGSFGPEVQVLVHYPIQQHHSSTSRPIRNIDG